MFPRSRASIAPKPGAALVPQCRAGWTRHLLKGLSALPRDLAERTRGAIGAERWSELESVNALRWLPFEVHMAVLGALRGVLGPDAYRKLCFDQISASLSLPELFEKPAKVALRIYGGPLALFRALPPGLPYIFRNAGHIRIAFEPGAEAVEVCYEDLPSRFARGDTWHLIWVATFEALAAHASVGAASLGANVKLTAHEPGHGFFKWRVDISA
jgi:hypothetical protein